MNLSDMITRRKSVRSYTGVPVDDATLAKIDTFIAGARPLYPDIRVQAEIVSRDQIRCIFPWVTPQLISVFSEDVPGALENVGFIFQQLDLYLQGLGLGACWLGMGRLNGRAGAEVKGKDGLKFVIMLAFGHPKGAAQRASLSEFKRKTLGEISDTDDPRLESARLAPSSVNSQPWRFTHEGDTIHAHCMQHGLFKAAALSDMNRIDMGIALAHLYVSNPDGFRFFRAENVSSPKGCAYIGSIVL